MTTPDPARARSQVDPSGPLDSPPGHDELEHRLGAFLTWWIGIWPPRAPLSVSGSPERTRPGWDGRVRPMVGIATPSGTVISVPPTVEEEARRLAESGLDALAAGLGALVGLPGATLARGVFRWSERVVEAEDVGEWVLRDDPRLPAWLHPFNGDVLVAFDADRRYAAGVGFKRHSPLGVEIAVGTEAHHRGRGLATRLVAQASRRVIAEGAVAIYLHSPDNIASAHVAERAGFPDEGWQVIELSPDNARPRRRAN